MSISCEVGQGSRSSDAAVSYTGRLGQPDLDERCRIVYTRQPSLPATLKTRTAWTSNYSPPPMLHVRTAPLWNPWFIRFDV